MRGGGGRWGFPGSGGDLTTVREGEEERKSGRRRGREGRDDSKKGGRAVKKEAVPWALMTRTQHTTHYL